MEANATLITLLSIIVPVGIILLKKGRLYVVSEADVNKNIYKPYFRRNIAR
jgi:hypothetical protein